jgi:hypothetical protein
MLAGSFAWLVLCRPALAEDAAAAGAVATGAAPADAAAADTAPASGADTPTDQPFAVHGQTTYVWQHKPAFASPYQGEHSLSGDRATSYSFTATVDVGARLWKGGEFHFNGEAAQGVPFSTLHGLGGLTNGELAKTSGADLTEYRARAFIRQTWGLGGGREYLDPDMNQLGTWVDKRRVVLTAGNVSVLDIFDGVESSHDPRTQFLNWSFMTYGSFDYAADARGYTLGAALEYIDDGWAVRAGRFAQPKESNGPTLDTNLAKHYGDQIEFEKSYSLWGRDGTARILGFRNRADMGSFDDALALAARDGGTPDVSLVRKEHTKLGMGLGFEQQLTDSLTAFFRVDQADGKTEAFAFTEIDKGVSFGLSAKGDTWSRPNDTVGLGVAINGLSSAHQQYLKSGGLGAFLGDGTLNYGTEQIAETYYSWQPFKHLWLTADAQYIRNPGYNRDRGPAKVYSLRVHAAF